MSDLISKKALIKAIVQERDQYSLKSKFNQALRGGFRKCLHIIETIHTIDAVEVVRCRDCEFYWHCKTSPAFKVPPPEDWYCADGIRKKD